MKGVPKPQRLDDFEESKERRKRRERRGERKRRESLYLEDGKETEYICTIHVRALTTSNAALLECRDVKGRGLGREELGVHRLCTVELQTEDEEEAKASTRA